MGPGRLGEALLSGMLRAGLLPGDAAVVVRRPERGDELAKRYGVGVMTGLEAAEFADVLLVAVKPQDIEPAVLELSTVSELPLIVSAVAGVPTSYFESRLPAGAAVVRVMTNTPVLVDEAMTVASAGANACETDIELTRSLFSSVGKFMVLPEKQQDAVTALSGSGPAYFFYLVEAMTDAGILLGLPRTVAAELLVQTALGAAVMLRDSGEHPVQLRESVTSPAGTTISAIRELENHGVRAALLSAIEAARDRSRELGESLK
ncbi:MAG: pyrroline-5-carboxylate reductase [Pseudonocardiales bacterium]|nr:pyrroline-5-carboxylate reductase [Pseudonocardiales bacterium]